MQNIIVSRYPPNDGHIRPDPAASRSFDGSAPYEVRDGNGIFQEGECVAKLEREWDGWIEPSDLSWIMFVRVDGTPVVFLDRDPVTGGIRDPRTGQEFNYPDIPV